MIVNIRHRPLRRFWERGQVRGLNPDWIRRVNRILSVLDQAQSLSEINLPGFRLHALSGNLSGFHAVTVSANWRIVFRFDGQDVFDVDLLDYH
ncbi:MAG: type II toxin-antitoxin system RelE/ParE family toxin [Bacteroidota bacterium]